MIVQNPQELVTSREAIRAGLLTHAKTKVKDATPYTEAAEELRQKLNGGEIRMEHIRDKLLTAFGLSQKAMNQLTADEMNLIIRETLPEFRDQYGDKWKDEIVTRFLMISGASLCGSAQNKVGRRANKEFTRSMLTVLGERGIKPQMKLSPSNKDNVQMVTWPGRALLFNKVPKFFKKSIDLVLVKSEGDPKTEIHELANCLACGELKGGTDPCGADEHWKTACGALRRIHTQFQAASPQLFFIGAVITETMAREIFEQIEENHLNYAANLTKPNQLTSLCEWLIDLE